MADRWKVFEFSNGNLLLVPAKAMCMIVSRPAIPQNSDAGEVLSILERWAGNLRGLVRPKE